MYLVTQLDQDEYLHVNQTCKRSDGLVMAKEVEFYLNFLIVAIGGPLNILVLVVQMLSNRINGYSTAALYMTNLSIANLLTVCVLPVVSLSNSQRITIDIYTCKLTSLLYYTSCTAGFVTLGLIALDRYRIIHMKQKSRQKTFRHSYAIIFTTWVAAIMMGTPAPIHTTILAHENVPVQDNEHFTCVVFFDYDQVKTLLVTFKILMCIIWGAVPVTLMTWFYVFFYRTLHKVSYKRRSRTLMFICVLLMSFLVLQTPYVVVAIFDAYALTTWELTCQNINHRETMVTLSRIIPNFHCLINPILYAFLGNDFTTKLGQCCRGELFSKRAFTRAQQTAHSNATATNAPSQRQRAPSRTC